ncbi:indole-3-glycerol phosphate synthase TrpC [Lactobacillus sp. S2-2]|uniref:indole-3-glycerol phosphate synthase TrpC n=1 Tax=Lactobacillus sp. S2-2 TaxID=2692917 RepID=UPI001F00D78D|nr:indole-3-glycerol phosphate synthase TrpC [Lactobacillus sp. S2-2]MCF6515004.1 indole-3-glycerol phosphate synthase TrpC [Lactobacillus sp. S2-2]
MILNDLVYATKNRIAKKQDEIPLEELKEKANNQNPKNSQLVYDIFLKSKPSIIGELKQASPSKGIIIENFDYLDILENYEKSNVDIISVLTEPDYFKGSLDILEKVAKKTDKPILRKDFIINEYMIYESFLSGADMILLITVILSDNQLKKYYELANTLGLAVLFETHNKSEIIRVLKLSPEVIGINNRNLKDFTVDIETSIKLRKYIPDSISCISESGIQNKEQISKLKNNKFNGFLIGESLIKSDNKKQFINNILGESI